MICQCQKVINMKTYKEILRPTVYVIQEIAGTKAGAPKINIMGASTLWTI